MKKISNIINTISFKALNSDACIDKKTNNFLGFTKYLLTHFWVSGPLLGLP